MKSFVCNNCKKEIEADEDWTEEKKLEEKEANGWGDMPLENCVTVCDDCYKEIMAYHDHEPRTKKETQSNENIN